MFPLLIMEPFTLLEVVETLSEPFIQQLNRLIGIEGQVEWIEKELRLMQSWLEHVRSKELRSQDEVAWAERVQKIFNEVGGTIDIFQSKSARHRRSGFLKRWLLALNRLADRLELARKVEKIKVQIRNVSKERLRLQEGTISSSPQGPVQDNMRPNVTTSNEAFARSCETFLAASNAVASAMDKINTVVNQNLLLHSGMKESVEHIRDDFRHLQSILNDFRQEAKEMDERTKSLVQEIKEASDLADRVLEPFVEQREKQLQKGRFFKTPFLVHKDLKLGKDMERINVRIQNLCNRKWIYGISDFKEREGPISTVPILKRGRALISPAALIIKFYLSLFFPLGSSLFIQAQIRSFMLVNKAGVQTAADQEESINRDLRLMQALNADVGDMKHLDERVTVWLNQMKEILDPQAGRQEPQEMTGILRWLHLRFRKARAQRKVAKKFKRMNNKLRDMSRRKWTYDIGKIEGERRSSAEDRSQQQEESATHNAVENQDSGSLEEAQQGSSDVLEQKDSIFDVIFSACIQVLTFGRLNPMSSEELHEHVESIQRERDLMIALVKDADSMGKLDARQTLWVEEIEEVEKEAEKLLNSYRESEGMGAYERYRFLKFEAPKKIEKIENRIHEISERKGTYDIGGIKGRKGLSSIQHKSSETTATSSSHGREDRRHAFRHAFNRFAFYYLQISIKLIYPRLAELVDQAEENAKSIGREVSRIDALHKDVGGREIQDRKLKAWLNEMLAVRSKAEDTIGDYNEKTKELRWRFNWEERRRMAKKIKSILKEIQDTYERKARYGIEHIQTREELSTIIRSPQPPSSIIQQSHIVGFYDDVQAVLAELLTNDEHCLVISIVGMAGIGKTFLAKFIYDAVAQHFPSRRWMNVEDHLKGMKEQVLPPGLPERKGKQVVEADLKEQKLTRHREGKGKEIVEEEGPMRLIVLDDVRTTEDWNRLMEEFPCNFNGSRIVLTTRNVDVATHADPKSPPHKLKLLSDDDSWALFTQTLTRPIPYEQLEQCRKMVVRCGGLPDSIVKLRKQSSSVESTSTSSAAASNPNLDQEETPRSPWQETVNTIKKGLLPSNQESCLLYLGRFPAEFEIPLRRLILLWIAEGLVHQRRADGDPAEYVAGKYLAELIDRNMVQVTKKKQNGEVKKCRLPYPVRQLWLPKEAAPSSSRTIRFLAYHPDPADASFDHIHGHITNLSNCSLRDYKHVNSIRSFDTREGSQPGKELGEFLDRSISRRSFLSLLVLDLERVFRPELPKALGELDLLKYLGLRWTYLQDLPSFISNLLTLQTLDLKHTSIKSLPTSIWKMVQLRHLYLDESYHCRFVPRPPRQSLTNLQTLWSVYIDENSPVKDGLDSLIHLKKLGVTTQLTSSLPGAMLAQMEAVANWVQKLEQLQSLRLKSFDKQGQPWCLPVKCLSRHTNLSSIYFLGRIHVEFLASGLPWALTDLTLSGSWLQEDPMQLLEHLSNLKILRLFSESFRGEHMLCSSRGFPQLQILKLWKLKQLKGWTVRAGAMPNLRDVEIRSCEKLKMLPDGLRHLRTLQELRLSEMPKEFTNGIKISQGEEWAKIEHVRYVSIDDNLVAHGEAAETSVAVIYQIWKKLYKAKINEEQKIFLSNLASGEQPQRSTEAEELPMGTIECPFCGAEFESAIHLFFLCKPIKMIWFAMWGIKTEDFANLSISEWIDHILTPSLLFRDSSQNETEFLLFAAILMEKTWLWRNRAISDHTQVYGDVIYKETCSSFMKMLSTRERRQSSELNVAL